MKTSSVNSRQARKRNRLMASTAEMASEAEPIELEESAGEEVVDLTCESSDPVVVDLTHNDSVVVSRQRRNLRLRSQRQSDSCVLSSDDEDETRDNDVYVTHKVSRELGPLEDETASSKYVYFMTYPNMEFCFSYAYRTKLHSCCLAYLGRLALFKLIPFLSEGTFLSHHISHGDQMTPFALKDKEPVCDRWQLCIQP
uniref:Ring finger protein 4 n=1 Tax=Amazona collaria TaxID=241587 RepID=A0A8B9F0R3_9PSIT